MNDIVGKVLEQDKSQKWFFIVTGVIFGGLATYLFIRFQAIPNQLETMWLSACGFIAAGFAKGVNKVEQLTGKDLDGDGDIGVDSQSTQPIQTAQAAPVQEVAKVVSYADAESDPSKYNLSGYAEQTLYN